MLTGLAQASTMPSPSASASPNPSVSAFPSPSVPTGGGGSNGKLSSGGQHGGTCSVTSTGRLADCQKPVATAKLPAGSRNMGTVGEPVSDLASLVDTRTWTTGGGNTFPGAEVPYGMVQWSPDTLPDRNAGGGYSFTDTSLTDTASTTCPGLAAAPRVTCRSCRSPRPSRPEPTRTA